MGTGNRLNSTTIPHMSLPHRRYSVPETVMRKYMLSRAQTSESGDSCIATVPTPSVPSGSLRSGRLHEEFFYHDYRGVIRKMHHKSCQTGDSDFLLPSQSPEFVDTIMPLAVITRTIRNILSEGDERMDSYNEESQSYHEECHEEIITQDISLPGSTVKNLITPKDTTSIQDEPVHKLVMCSDTTSSGLSEASRIADSDILGLLEDKNVQCLLQNITHKKTVNLLLRMKAKSLSDCDNVVINKQSRKVHSADKKHLTLNSNVNFRSINHECTNSCKELTEESKPVCEDSINFTNKNISLGENNITKETDNVGIIEKEDNGLTIIEENILNEVVLENMNKETYYDRPETNSVDENETSDSKEQEYVEDTPTPIPPSSTATESNSYPRSSESMDCYVTDCDLCNIEGRKCCCFEDTIDSQFCSFTSPDMLTTNELKTSSDFTSTSVTLDQTVTDRSTSTQDSTLSITSVTPDSSNKTNDLNVNSLSQNLVINTETVLVKAINTNDTGKSYTFQLSDSPSEVCLSTGINDSEVVLDRRKNFNSDNNEHFEMPLVISSECALIEPVLFKRTFDLFETNSDVCSSPENNISHKETATNCAINENMNLEKPLCVENVNAQEIKSFEVHFGSDKEQMEQNLIEETVINMNSNETNIKEKQLINNNEHFFRSTSCYAGKSNIENSSQISPKDMTYLQVGTTQTEFGNNNTKDDFEPDSLMFDESGNSEDATVIENRSGQVQFKTKNEDCNKGYYTCDLEETEDDEPYIEESALLEQLGLQDNEKQEKQSTFSQLCGNESKKKNYEEMCKKQVQDIFYGNSTYELIVKDIPPNSRTFKANVMSTVDNNATSNSKKSSELNKNIDIDTDLVCTDHMERVTEFTLTEDDSIQLCKENNCSSDNGNPCEGTTMGTVSTGTYWETPGTELIIPRYSALPRTLSMLVNTSSIDYSSDSDLSLPDSLEDVHITKAPITWPSSKHDNRLVRGDVMSLLPEKQSTEKKVSSKESQAYFVSLSGEEQEIKPEPIPEPIKQKLLKRDNELKKHTEHHSQSKSRHTSKKGDHKKVRKYQASTIKMSPGKGCETKCTKFQNVEKRTISTQWEDISSSREDSSDTLIPADITDEEKHTDDVKILTENKEDTKVDTDLTAALDSIQNGTESVSLEVSVGTAEIEKRGDNQTNIEDVNSNDTDIENLNKVVEKHKSNKGIQCSKLIYDTEFDKQISAMLISAYVYDESILQKELDEKIKNILLEGLEKLDSEDNNVLKCAESSLYNDPGTSVYEETSKVKVDEQQLNLVESKSVQTAFSDSEEIDETSPLSKQIQTEEMFLSEDGIEFRKQTTFSQLYFEKNKNFLGTENENHYIELQNMKSEKGILETAEQRTVRSNLTSSEQTWVTEDSIDINKAHSERQNGSSISSKNKFNFSSNQSTKFNVKTVSGRRSGNISKRFRQRFEVIPEEKSGSMESSADEKNKSPVPQRNRRLSVPLDILPDRLISSNKNYSGSSSSNERQEDMYEHSCDPKHGNVKLEANESQRRHTIHGIGGKGIRAEVINKSIGKSEHRRHTIHGNLSLSSKQNEIIKKLNLMGGTVLKGRVYSKRTGLMFGKFRPINEETQVEKDEKILVGEQIEKMRKSGCKGRQALAIAQAGEQEELLTLSKGWINFYLLRDSQECGSPESSNGEEGHLNSSLSEDKLRHVAPSMKTVTVVGMPENKVRQYTVQIQASPEAVQPNETSKLPELNSHILLSPRTPPQSPDLVLPHLSPMSSPNSQSPLLSETSNNLETELPKLLGDKSKLDNKHTRRKVSSKSDYRVKIPSSPVDSDNSLGFVHLPGSKLDLHSHKTFLSHSTEIVQSGASTPNTSSTCDSASESSTLPSIRWPTRQLQKRSHPKKQRSETSKHVPPLNTNNNPGQACWTVTVASNSGCPSQPPPDVEMRLSFSNTMRPTPPSQSDSGLGEDNNMVKKSKRFQALPSSAQKWSLTMKNQQQGRESEKSSDLRRAEKQLKCLQETTSCHPSRACSTTKSSKRRSSSIESEERQHFSFFWPKVQEIVDDDINRASVFDGELSVTGLAIMPERKPRVPTMSERDLTRHLIAHHRHHRSTLIKHSF